MSVVIRERGILRLSSEMLDDADYGTLNDRLYRRYIECALLASRCEPIGWLPDMAAAAWILHSTPEQLHNDLIELWQEGVVKRGMLDSQETWYIPGVEPPSMTRRETIRYDFVRLRKARYEELAKRNGEYCQWCGATSGLSVDHIIAVANGGGNELDNLQLLCRSCNSRKGAR